MRIMNGNDSVVKCFCFFRFLSLPFFSRCSGSVTGVVLCGDRPADSTASWWTAATRLWEPIRVFIKRSTAAEMQKDSFTLQLELSRTKYWSNEQDCPLN